MFDLVGPPSNARCPEPSLPSGALPTSQETCITTTNPLDQVRSGGKEEGESCLASTLPVILQRETVDIPIVSSEKNKRVILNL